jgi:hypothetical protein
MILFETSASVFELMWDIALALFIIRISFVYCTLAFLASWLLTYLRSSPLISFHIYNSLFFPLNILAVVLISQLLVRFYEIPRVVGFRLTIGLLGLFFMVWADLVAGLVVYEEGWGSWAWRTSGVDIVEGSVWLAVFTLMPALWMFGEKLTDEMGDPVTTTAHGHERKKVVDAV